MSSAATSSSRFSQFRQATYSEGYNDENLTAASLYGVYCVSVQGSSVQLVNSFGTILNIKCTALGHFRVGASYKWNSFVPLSAGDTDALKTAALDWLCSLDSRPDPLVPSVMLTNCTFFDRTKHQGYWYAQATNHSDGPSIPEFQIGPGLSLAASALSSCSEVDLFVESLDPAAPLILKGTLLRARFQRNTHANAAPPPASAPSSSLEHIVVKQEPFLLPDSDSDDWDCDLITHVVDIAPTGTQASTQASTAVPATAPATSSSSSPATATPKRALSPIPASFKKPCPASHFDVAAEICSLPISQLSVPTITTILDRAFGSSPASAPILTPETTPSRARAGTSAAFAVPAAPSFGSSTISGSPIAAGSSTRAPTAGFSAARTAPVAGSPVSAAGSSTAAPTAPASGSAAISGSPVSAAGSSAVRTAPASGSPVSAAGSSAVRTAPPTVGSTTRATPVYTAGSAAAPTATPNLSASSTPTPTKLSDNLKKEIRTWESKQAFMCPKGATLKKSLEAGVVCTFVTKTYAQFVTCCCTEVKLQLIDGVKDSDFQSGQVYQYPDVTLAGKDVAFVKATLDFWTTNIRHSHVQEIFVTKCEPALRSAGLYDQDQSRLVWEWEAENWDKPTRRFWSQLFPIGMLVSHLLQAHSRVTVCKLADTDYDFPVMAMSHVVVDPKQPLRAVWQQNRHAGAKHIMCTSLTRFKYSFHNCFGKESYTKVWSVGVYVGDVFAVDEYPQYENHYQVLRRATIGDFAQSMLEHLADHVDGTEYKVLRVTPSVCHENNKTHESFVECTVECQNELGEAKSIFFPRQSAHCCLAIEHLLKESGSDVYITWVRKGSLDQIKRVRLADK